MGKNKVKKDYWEQNWADFRIPFEINWKKEHHLYNILKRVLPDRTLTLLEIGCAPGGWLAFFKRYFKLDVFGVDYAENAVNKTRENLNLLNIPTEIFNDDIFKFKHEPFDVIFSAGFIEHFDDLNPIMNKIDHLCKSNGGIVITMIPNLQGLNLWISKTFRPKVAAQHRSISLEELIEIHEARGFKTIFAYSGRPFYILPPVYLNNFWKKYPRISMILNSPIHVWNIVSRTICRWLKFYPKVHIIGRDKMYIGVKS
jgi:SAM-dependent methyltransferase